MALVTTIDAAILARRLNKKPDDPEVARCLEVAIAVLEDYLEDAIRPVPPAVVDDCVVRVGRAVFDSTARGGGGAAQQTQVGTGDFVRGPRDPLTPVYPMLARYVLVGLA